MHGNAWQGMSALTMRVSVAEQARLSVLIGRRAFRTFLGRINAHPLLRWRFVSTKTDRLVPPAPAKSTLAVLPLPAKW